MPEPNPMYPPFKSKTEFVQLLADRAGDGVQAVYELLNRLSSTNTSIWTDPRSRHDGA